MENCNYNKSELNFLKNAEAYVVQSCKKSSPEEEEMVTAAALESNGGDIMANEAMFHASSSTLVMPTSIVSVTSSVGSSIPELPSGCVKKDYLMAKPHVDVSQICVLDDEDEDEEGDVVGGLHHYEEVVANRMADCIDESDDEASLAILEWLLRSSPSHAMVYPVWVGNLPSSLSVQQLRDHVESKLGAVLISVYVGHAAVRSEEGSLLKQKQTYAFLNFPDAKRQAAAMAVLEKKPFRGSRLVARVKPPSRFPFLNYCLTKQKRQRAGDKAVITEHFKYFKDEVLPLMLHQIDALLKTAPFQRAEVLEFVARTTAHQYCIDPSQLPNRLWCVECNLRQSCNRKYCSFYHNHTEQQLGEIFVRFANRHFDLHRREASSRGDSDRHQRNRHHHHRPSSSSPSSSSPPLPADPSEAPLPLLPSSDTLTLRFDSGPVDRHTVLTLFATFGEIKSLKLHQPTRDVPFHCTLQMKTTQAAQVIEFLFRSEENRTGINVSFAPIDQTLGVDDAVDYYCGNIHMDEKIEHAKSFYQKQLQEKIKWQMQWQQEMRKKLQLQFQVQVAQFMQQMQHLRAMEKAQFSQYMYSKKQQNQLQHQQQFQQQQPFPQQTFNNGKFNNNTNYQTNENTNNTDLCTQFNSFMI